MGLLQRPSGWREGCQGPLSASPRRGQGPLDHEATEGARGEGGGPEDLQEAGLRLDRLYIPTRYANSFDSGAPADYFGEKDAREAIGDAAAIVDFCEGQIPGSGEDG